MDDPIFISLLEKVIEARKSLFDDAHHSAFRLFNGFTEGNPDLVVDLYASTLVIHNYADKPEQGLALVHATWQFLPARLPWIQAVIVKTRNSPDRQEKRGQLVYGETVDRKILEN